MNNIQISFEFFPAKTENALQHLVQTAQDLMVLKPEFFSVTYGAGGTTQEFTVQTLQRLSQTSAVPLIGHLTCVGKTKDQVNAVAQEFAQMGVKHILALRGDGAGGIGTFKPFEGGYRDGADLIKGLKQLGDFKITAAAYPEKHPDSASMDFDIINMYNKFTAGADQFITQFFYDMDAFYKFMERADKAGISARILPGILPIVNFETMCKFAARCGTHVPQVLHDAFDGAKDEDKHKIAIDIAVKQCQSLLDNGIKNLHFYTLNRADMILDICKSL